MKNSVLRPLLLISLVFNFSILATVGYHYFQRQATWTSPFGHTIKKGHFLFEQLALSPDQIKVMRGQAIPFREEIDRQRLGIAKGRQGLLQLMRQEVPDMGAIEAQVKAIGLSQQEMEMRVASHLLTVKGLLPPEMRGRFFDLIEQGMNQEGDSGCQHTH